MTSGTPQKAGTRAAGVLGTALGAAYNMILRKVRVQGREKRRLLNDFALWTAAAARLGAGVFAGMVVGQALGVTVGVVAGIVAGSVAWSYAADVVAKGRYWRP